jgi:polysaccharide deacetylase 2 family uncharacterized protein YibQ
MKRPRKKNFASSHRVSIAIFFMAAMGVLLVLSLSLWPGITPQDHETKDRGHTGYINSDESSQTTSIAHSSGTEKATVTRRKGTVAIVIDDAGYDLEALDRFLAFKGKLTIAVLPQVTYSTQAAEKIYAAGKEVMLHLPMEPLGDADPGPGVLEVAFTEMQINDTLDDDFADVPHARGMNNHMGSLATQDPTLMTALFSYLKKHGIYFVDSRTTAATLGKEIATRFGVPMAERTYFLDNTPEKKAVIRVLLDGAAVARVKGKALLIGHVNNTVVAEVLEELFDELTASGLEFVTVSEYIKDSGESR